MPDPQSQSTPSTGTTKWDTTKQWVKRPTVSRGSTAILVAALIASSDTIYGIINDGIAEKPMNHWVAIKVLFIMALAAAHNFGTYTDDTHAKSREEKLVGGKTSGFDPEGHLK